MGPRAWRGRRHDRTCAAWGPLAPPGSMDATPRPLGPPAVRAGRRRATTRTRVAPRRPRGPATTAPAALRKASCGGDTGAVCAPRKCGTRDPKAPPQLTSPRPASPTRDAAEADPRHPFRPLGPPARGARNAPLASPAEAGRHPRPFNASPVAVRATDRIRRRAAPISRPPRRKDERPAAQGERPAASDARRTAKGRHAGAVSALDPRRAAGSPLHPPLRGRLSRRVSQPAARRALSRSGGRDATQAPRQCTRTPTTATSSPRSACSRHLCANRPVSWDVGAKLQNSLARSNRSRFG